MSTTNNLADAAPVKRGGPKTLQGQEIAKHNAMVHGLSDRRIIIPALGEREEDYRALEDGLLNEFRPSSLTERLYVRDLTTILWLLERVHRYANAVVERRCRQVTEMQKAKLCTADAAIKESRENLEDAQRLLELVERTPLERGVLLRWEAIPDSLWEALLADLQPRMPLLPARELSGMQTPKDVLATLWRELQLFDVDVYKELLRVAQGKLASAQQSVDEAQASRETITEDFESQLETAAVPSESEWAQIQRVTSSLEKQRRNILEMLLKFPALRRELAPAGVREIPPPDGVGRGAEDVPEVQA